jgi:hypothetical protein
MDVCLLWVLCVVRSRAGHSSRGVLPSVLCLMCDHVTSKWGLGTRKGAVEPQGEKIYIYIHIYTYSRDSAVGTATRYELDGPGIESQWGRDFQHPSRPALGPTQHPVQWITGHSRA